jgi:hypothetical protein
MFNRNKTGSQLCSGLALMIVAAVSAATRADERPGYSPPDYILTVGIGEYAHIKHIPGAANDPKLMLDIWSDAKSKVEPLINEHATADAIREALKQIKTSVKPGGFSVVFISSHGQREGGRWSALAHDYDPLEKPASTRVTGQEIARELDALIARGDRVLLIVDACYAGQLRSDFEWILGNNEDPFKVRGQLILLVATVPSQKSFEEGNNGLFSSAVAEGLRGQADADRDGFVTLRELRRYLSWRLPKAVQTATLPGLRRDEQDFLCDATGNVSDLLPLSCATEECKPHITADQRLREKLLGIGTKSPPERGDLGNCFLDAFAQPNIPDWAVGQWRYDRTFTQVERLFPGGKPLVANNEFRESVNFRLTEDGRYHIEYLTYRVVPAATGPSQLKLIDSLAGSGRCRYDRLATPSFVLDVGDGFSYLIVKKPGEKEMELKADIPADWNKGVWTLRKQ